MPESPSEHIPFSSWVDLVFGNPANAVPWHDNSDWDEHDAVQRSPTQSLAYLAKLLNEADELLTPYTDAQIANALQYFIDTGASDYAVHLVDHALPIELRIACVQSFICLFERLFAKRSTPRLSHILRTADPDMSPLNMVCYMWWDIFPTWGTPNDPRAKVFDLACLGVMAKILHIDHPACQESALHGLGHWHMHYAPEVETIIDNWLASKPAIPGELLSYAQSARQGCVN